MTAVVRVTNRGLAPLVHYGKHHMKLKSWLINGSYNQDNLIGADSQIPLACGLNVVNQK